MLLTRKLLDEENWGAFIHLTSLSMGKKIRTSNFKTVPRVAERKRRGVVLLFEENTIGDAKGGIFHRLVTRVENQQKEQPLISGKRSSKIN